MTNQFWHRLLWLNLLCLLIGNCLVGCKNIEPVKIGLIGTLMGRTAVFGIQARDGALLAVEQCNQAGGIQGRPTELLIKNDQATPSIAREAYRELVAARVVAIISQMNSTITDQFWPERRHSKVLMLGQMTGSGISSDRDEYYFNLHGSNRRYVKCLVAETTRRRLKRAALAYDTTNNVFGTDWVTCFTTYFEQAGGQVVLTVPFTSGNATSLSTIADQLLQVAPDLVLAVANSYDAAILFQKIRLKDRRVQLAITDWANTNGFLEYGGPAVEGVFLNEAFDEDDCTEKCLKFKNDYRLRFGSEPTGPAKSGYETTQVLLEVLKQTRAWDADSLKNTLLRQRIFQGLQGKFVIDHYGDAQRQCFTTMVENGQFRSVNHENQ